MGRRGPPKTPGKVLQLRGSALATKRRLAAEVAGPAGAPEMPDWLSDDERRIWDKLVTMLSTMGVLSSCDEFALSRYVHLWVRWRTATAWLAEHGDMYPLKDEAGKVRYMQQWPQVAIANKLAVELRRLEQEFGLTPAARTRIEKDVNQHAGQQQNAKARFFAPRAG